MQHAEPAPDRGGLVVTVTPNPSMDVTAALDHPLQRGAVHRLGRPLRDPGGKGVNVARIVHLAGGRARAVLPADDTDEVVQALREQGLPLSTVATGAPVRRNLAVVEHMGVTTKLNEPGARLTAPVVTALGDEVVRASERADWVVLAGSLPPGMGQDWYAQLCRRLGGGTARVAVDTSDAALRALLPVLGTGAVSLLKPNAEELAQLVDADPDELEGAARAGDWTPALRAAGTLVRGGAGAVLATLGAAGAVLVTRSGAWAARAPAVEVASTVGAGDAALAGLLIAGRRGGDGPDSLRWAVAYGAAAASLPGTRPPTPVDARALLARIVVHAVPTP